MFSMFQVVCTGKEERLLDCDFPQDFGVDYGSDSYTPIDDYANWPGPSHAAPESAPMENAPAPSGGLPSFICDRDTERLSVICRQFEITGALVLIVNFGLWHVDTNAACQYIVVLLKMVIAMCIDLR